MVWAERERLHGAREANVHALRTGKSRLTPEGAATEAQRRHRAAALQVEWPCIRRISLRASTPMLHTYPTASATCYMLLSCCSPVFSAGHPTLLRYPALPRTR